MFSTSAKGGKHAAVQGHTDRGRLSALKLQCLNRRIPTKEKMKEEVAAWLADRNATRRKIDWQFTTAEARIKLKRVYPVIEAHD